MLRQNSVTSTRERMIGASVSRSTRSISTVLCTISLIRTAFLWITSSVWRIFLSETSSRSWLTGPRIIESGVFSSCEMLVRNSILWRMLASAWSRSRCSSRLRSRRRSRTIVESVAPPSTSM